MTELPTEIRDLIDSGQVDIPESELTVEDLLTEEVAALATAPPNGYVRPKAEERRGKLVNRYRRIKEIGQSIDDALLDQMRSVRVQREEVEHATKLLLTYARTVPARDRKYRLRELAEASGIAISSIRDLISEAQMEDIERILSLDDERLSRLDSEREKS